MLRNKTRIKVIVTAASLAPKSGGPARTITGLVASLNAEGVNAALVAGIAPTQDGTPVLPKFVEKRLTSVGVRYVGPVRVYPQMAEAITNQAAKAPDSVPVIHDNGIWGLYNREAFIAASHLNAPYLLSPRGMMETWSLAQKRLKKKVAMTLFQRRILAGTAVFVATAVSEAESVRRLGLKQPIAIVPNGITLHGEETFGHFATRSAANRQRTLLFLSRIHPKKGIPLLLNAWALVRPAGWRLRIAGYDEAGHEVEVRRLVKQLHIGDSVEILGPVEGAAKHALFRDADVFILPTYSENFGVVVAEALDAGLPVITTIGAPWSGLTSHQCGWWIDVSVPAICEAICDATRLTDYERQQMGARARQYVSKFGWRHVAQQMQEVYTWVAGLGDLPPSVLLD